MKTYWDIERQGRDESWRRIRALRSAPPPGVTEDRRVLFTSALEQAEQQFNAAASVGPQSRPLNLFYGLSQAGRAVATARAPRDEGYRLQGHGIRCPGLTEHMAREPLQTWNSIVVKGLPRDRDSSFQRLSSLLGSNNLSSGVALSALLAMIVESQMHEPFDTAQHAPVGVLTPRGTEVFMRVRDHTAESDVPILVATYPDLEGTEFSHFQDDLRGRGMSVCLRRLDGSGEAVLMGSNYRGSRVAMPAVAAASPRTLHPLMVWWSALFTLSMLARYEPAAWSALIDLDRSKHAVPIEYLLNQAQESVPDILWRTIIMEP